MQGLWKNNLSKYSNKCDRRKKQSLKHFYKDKLYGLMNSSSLKNKLISTTNNKRKINVDNDFTYSLKKIKNDNDSKKSYNFLTKTNNSYKKTYPIFIIEIEKRISLSKKFIKNNCDFCDKNILYKSYIENISREHINKKHKKLKNEFKENYVDNEYEELRTYLDKNKYCNYDNYSYINNNNFTKTNNLDIKFTKENISQNKEYSCKTFKNNDFKYIRKKVKVFKINNNYYIIDKKNKNKILDLKIWNILKINKIKNSEINFYSIDNDINNNKITNNIELLFYNGLPIDYINLKQAKKKIYNGFDCDYDYGNDKYNNNIFKNKEKQNFNKLKNTIKSYYGYKLKNYYEIDLDIFDDFKYYEELDEKIEKLTFKEYKKQITDYC
jgi:hypothetical protein